MAATASSSRGSAPSTPQLPLSPRTTTGTPGKRRANDLLRNYYGLSSSSAPSNAAGAAASASLTQAAVTPIGPPDTGDARDPDSSRFDGSIALRSLLREKGLSQLLAHEADLLTEIRELDGERQSLVYNHHHELVAASETIRKMKDRGDALTPSLSSLQQSLRETSNTSKSLAIPAELYSQPKVVSIDQGKERGGGKLSADEAQRLIAPVVELPHRLRDLIVLGEPGTTPKQEDEVAHADVAALQKQKEGLAAAERLWGRMEAVLSAWVEAGVPGAKEISAECRVVLREARASASSS